MGLVPAAILADEMPSLPGGAAQFSRILAARTRWIELGEAIAKRGEISHDEWQNARAYLRAFYSIGDDMLFLANPWDAKLKEQAARVAKTLRKTVKAMDTPAKKEDVDGFIRLHGESTQLVDKFFAILKDATVSDIPEEL